MHAIPGYAAPRFRSFQRYFFVFFLNIPLKKVPEHVDPLKINFVFFTMNKSHQEQDGGISNQGATNTNQLHVLHQQIELRIRDWLLIVQTEFEHELLKLNPMRFYLPFSVQCCFPNPKEKVDPKR